MTFEQLIEKWRKMAREYYEEDKLYTNDGDYLFGKGVSYEECADDLEELLKSKKGLV